MNKQKTLIFSLSAILFLALSFIAYSFTEPTTMPSSYNPPINTSTTGQTKKGQLKLEGPLYAPMIYDQNNTNYYIDPSGNSIIAGKIITENEIQDSDPFGTIVTKGYLDQKIVNFAQDNNLFSNIMYIPGDNVYCPDNTTEIMKHWVARTCYRNTSTWNCDPETCQISASWQNLPPTCTVGYNNGTSCSTTSCAANAWDAILCGINQLPENMLFGLNHSMDDCESTGGTIVTVEDDVKICKFSYEKLSGNCRNYNCWPCYYDHCVGDTCSCPAGWRPYKSWMQTSANYKAAGHAWANQGRANYWDGECDAWLANVDYKGCY